MHRPVPTVPITMGSPRFRSVEVECFRITEAWFPPGTVLPSHTHDRPCVAVMLDGSFDLRFPGKSFECPPGTAFTEPAGEAHANFMGSAGAHVVVVQPDPGEAELLRPFLGLVESTTHRRDAGIAGQATQLARELRGVDQLSSLAAEGIALEMLVGLARLQIREGRRPPAWLLRAQELLHGQFTRSIRIAEVASAVGVHPAHLARTFKSHFKRSIGSYVRQLRLDWAARELARPDVPLVMVALAAGFADQSHFTRAFKRYTGVTPQVYRRSMRN